VIFGAAFITRLASAVYILSRYSSPQLLFFRNEPSHIAAALASGMGFAAPYANVAVAPSAQQPPLYPLLLAGIFKVFGIFTVPSVWTAVLVNILAGAVTAVLLYKVGKLHFSETVGIWAAWLWVLPWTYGINTFSVSLTSACLAAMGVTTLLLWSPKSLNGNGRCFGFGIHCGTLVFLQPVLLTVIVVYGVWLAWRQVRPRQVWIAVAGLVLVVSPWTLRNYLVLGRLIPLRDNFGLELWLGNRPGMSGTVDFAGDFPDVDPTHYARLGELPFMDAKFQEAKEFILREPAVFVGRVLRRTVEFWYRPYSLPWIVVAIMGCLGTALLAGKDRQQWVWLVMPTVFPLVYYVTHNFPNYRHPIEPVVILLAGYGMAKIVPYEFKERSGRFGIELKQNRGARS
jgi:Dolichyl-phosphate-mannose-protein mannosyltransferase